MNGPTAYGEPVEGTPFGRYRLIELLGRGGMGEVWRAHDTVTDRVVAIKVLPTNLSGDEDFQLRFRREAHAAARLDTPHVVPIHDYGEIDGRLFVSMRLIKGRDLETVLADGPLDPARAVRIIDQVARALHVAHKVGLIHRDIKPSNILLDGDDFAYLIDFGIARVADETRMTKSGNTIGTFAYIAPERLDSQAEEDARADIYSLACVLYEALTGEPPFAGTSTAQLIAAHLNAPPPRPSASQPHVPQAVDEVIATGMAKDPDLRYATTVELANAAHDAITTPLAPPSKPTRLVEQPPPAPGPTRRDDQVPPPPQPVWQQPANLNLAAPQQRQPGWPPAPQAQPANHLPPQIDTGPPQPWRPRRDGLKWGLLAAVVVILAGAGISGYLLWPRPSASQTRPAGPSAQTGLPFTGLTAPWGLAVDAVGNVYVADSGNNRVVELAAGASTQSVLPFTGLDKPKGVAVDKTGSVYVTDFNNRVLKLAAGSSTQTVLPFAGLKDTWAQVAVDSAGDVYVTDNDRVVKLAAGSSSQTVLPFTDINLVAGLAVDSAGTVYVGDRHNNRVVKLAPGSGIQTELFGGVNPWGVAVDSAGTVYATDNTRLAKLPAGSSTPSFLPVAGSSVSNGVGVDAVGNLYVADMDTNQVAKLRAG